VVFCAVVVVLVGYLVSISLLLVVAENSAMGTSRPFHAANPEDVSRSICGAVYGYLVAGASAAAAREYWRRKRRGLAVHLLAIVLLLPVVSVAPAGIPLVAVSFAILATMAAHLKASRALVVTAFGFALTLATFLYQRMGPDVGKYGTECIPIEDCFGPLLGAGFPLQYLVNVPGITDPTSLGGEDELRLLPFAIDTLAFSVISYLGSTALRRARLHVNSPERDTGSPSDPSGTQPKA
jgi:hypothetical protein